MSWTSKLKSDVAKQSGEKFFKPSGHFLRDHQTNTSHSDWSICDPASDEKIAEKYLQYFAARCQNEVHDLVLKSYSDALQRGVSRADIAKRLDKRPEQITRWLGSPGNWTLETVSNLLLALGQIPEFRATPLSSLSLQSQSDEDGNDTVSITITFQGNEPRSVGRTANVTISDSTGPRSGVLK